MKPAKDDQDIKGDEDIKGEGNYSATRRHRESAEQFVESGRVDEAARDAQPRDEREAAELQDAEQQGRDKARH